MSSPQAETGASSPPQPPGPPPLEPRPRQRSSSLPLKQLWRYLHRRHFSKPKKTSLEIQPSATETCTKMLPSNKLPVTRLPAPTPGTAFEPHQGTDYALGDTGAAETGMAPFAGTAHNVAPAAEQLQLSTTYAPGGSAPDPRRDIGATGTGAGPRVTFDIPSLSRTPLAQTVQSGVAPASLSGVRSRPDIPSSTQPGPFAVASTGTQSTPSATEPLQPMPSAGTAPGTLPGTLPSEVSGAIPSTLSGTSGALPSTASGAGPAGLQTPSLRTQVLKRNGPALLHLVDPITGQPSKGATMYSDPFFGFPTDFVEKTPGKLGAAVTQSGNKATTPLRDDGLKLQWSGVQPPASLAGSEQPRASSLSDEGPRKVMSRMLDILDRYLNAHPGERTVALHDREMPGPDAIAISAESQMHEDSLTFQIRIKLFALVNKILELFNRAVQWYAEPLDKDTPFPVPLDGALKLATFVTADTDAQGVSEAANYVEPDFALTWDKGMPNVNVGVGQIEHRLEPEDAVDWTAPKAHPLDPKVPAVPSHSTAGPAPGTSTGRSGTAARAGRPKEQDGHLIDTWQNKVSLQDASQLYLNNSPCGALIGDFGQMLVLYELGHVPGQPSNVFALCFARECIRSFPPQDGDRTRNTDPDVLAQHLNQVLSFDQEQQQSSIATTSEGAASLRFTARPGMVWGLVHWALWAYHVAVNQEHRQHRHHIAVPVQQEHPAADSPQPDEAPAPVCETSPIPARQPTPDGDLTASIAEEYTPRKVKWMTYMHCPFTWGMHADIHSCMVLSRERYREPLTYDVRDVDKAKTVMKIHCPPLADPDDVPEELLCSPNGEYIPEDIRRPALTELTAYGRLVPLQGSSVPRLIGTASERWGPHSHAPKLILERVGMPLHQIAEECPATYLNWQSAIEEQTRAAVKACHALAVVNGDLHGANIVAEWVRTTPSNRPVSADASGDDEVTAEDPALGGGDAGSSSTRTHGPVPRMLVTDVDDILAHVHRLSFSRPEPRPDYASSTGDELRQGPSLLEVALARRAYQMVKMSARDLRLRVALIDWSSAFLDAPYERKAREIADVEKTLKNMEERATHYLSRRSQ